MTSRTLSFLTFDNSARTLKNQTLPKGVQPSQPPPRSYRAWWVGGFLFGFAIGLTLSLTYGWLLDPRPLPVTPADLRPSAQATYLRLIALAYAHNHRLDQAQTRLDSLANPNIKQTLTMMTEAYINQGRDIRDITALVELAQALGNVSPLMATYLTTPTSTPTVTPTSTTTRTPTSTHTPTITPSPSHTPTRTPTTTPTINPSITATLTLTPTIMITLTSTRTPTPTLTPFPTATPTINYNAPVTLKKSQAVCDDLNTGLLRIYIHDRLGHGIPGVQIKVQWASGEDNLFTGFKPDIDLGYADFQMKATEIYQLDLVNLKVTQPLPEITIGNITLCQPNLPAWQVVLAQGAK